MVRHSTVIFFLGVVIAVAGCGSSKEVGVTTPEDRFARAIALFQDNDLLEAINEFTVITLQYPGSSVAADAQFYLGESRFRREEYVLAGFEYSILKRNYPASARVPEAQYKMALCYYELSPRPPLDQEYTRKAVDEFQAFVEYYPGDPMAADAEVKIRELTQRLARKQYETARLYATMQYSRAALLSYDVVIERYHDTEFAPLAFVEKAELLIDRGRFAEAALALEQFLAKYPNSVLRARAERLRADAEAGVRSTQDTPQGARVTDTRTWVGNHT